jgi:hypothetical protein
MPQTANLDYFYRNEAEQYSFYRIPKILFTDERYRNVTAEAKVLYGLMLDRMSLSIKNSWIDDKGHVFIYFTLEDALSLLCCGHGKAVRLFSELDTKSGVGLIERRKQGQGRPTKIFVKNFATAPELKTSENEKSEPLGETENSVSEDGQPESLEQPEVLTSENEKSAFPKTGSPDFSKSDGNKTNTSNTDWNDTDLSIHPTDKKSEVTTPDDSMEAMEVYRKIIRENIAYDILQQKCDADRLDEIVDIILETVCSRKQHIRIAGDDIPAEAVKNRLLKLNDNHIEYVLECLDQNTTKIRNIRSYLLTALYQAPTTISSYYAAKVSHDLYGGDGGP